MISHTMAKFDSSWIVQSKETKQPGDAKNASVYGDRVIKEWQRSEIRTTQKRYYAHDAR